MRHFLDFEKPIAELEGKIEELRRLPDSPEVDIAEEIGRLGEKVEKLLAATYARLTPWQKTQVARHPARPHARDVVGGLIEEFVPLAGDRGFADDRAVLGTEKGDDPVRARIVGVDVCSDGRDGRTRSERAAADAGGSASAGRLPGWL